MSFRHKSKKQSCKFQVQVATVEMSLLSVNLNVFFMLVTLSCKRIDNVLNVQAHCLQSLSDMITSRVSIVCYHATRNFKTRAEIECSCFKINALSKTNNVLCLSMAETSKFVYKF